jgi:hypothetical protein
LKLLGVAHALGHAHSTHTGSQTPELIHGDELTTGPALLGHRSHHLTDAINLPSAETTGALSVSELERLIQLLAELLLLPRTLPHLAAHVLSAHHASQG